MKKKEKEKDYSEIFEYFKKNDNDIISFEGQLGKGAFGEVRKCKCIFSKDECAAKLVEKEKSDNIEPEKLRGKNIIEIYKISERKVEDKYYDLIIMELAVLRDTKKFFTNLANYNLLKTINRPFDEVVSDNILRFFVKQIVNGLELFERNEFVHFDIKPENILITNELTIKLSDFSFLKDLNKEKDELKIPGGTKGFVPPEYYNKILGNKYLAKKQDYFALGATIYFFKFNELLLKYTECPKPDSNQIQIISQLQKSISKIKSNLLLNKDFISFLCSLIQYSPEDRPNFEEIYRNKWLNENRDEIKEIASTYSRNEEKKLILELIKSDFLIEKKKKNKTIKKSRFKFVK